MTQVQGENPHPDLRLGVVAHEEKVIGDHGLEALRAALAAVGQPDPPWRSVRKAKKAAKAVAKMVEDDGVNHVLVWGGDGTTRRCIGRIVADGLPCTVGLLPAGTHNMLARNLGVPFELDGAVDIALRYRPTAIDVLTTGDQHFAVTGGIGFDAMMTREAEESGLKAKYGPIAHLVAGARVADSPPAEARVEVDGEVLHEGPATCVLFSNVPTLLGGITAFPQARPDDGKVHVAVIAATGKTQWARVVGRALLADVAGSDLVTVGSGASVEVGLDRSLPWELDGSDRGRTDHVTVSCLPGAVGVARDR